MSLLLSSSEEKQLGNDLKYSRLHKVFDTILKSFVEAQDGALNDIPITFGDVTKEINLKLPCFFIIGDMQGGDVEAFF